MYLFSLRPTLRPIWRAAAKREQTVQPLQSASSDPRRSRPSGSVATNGGEESFVVLPTLGRIKVTVKPVNLSWESQDKKRVVLPFKFLYAPNGVWVRATYVNDNPYPETSVEDLEQWHWFTGQDIMGIPKEAPSSGLLQEILTNASGIIPLEKASRIMIDYTMMRRDFTLPVEPVIEVRIYGLETPDSGARDHRRLRIVYALDHKDYTLIDTGS